MYTVLDTLSRPVYILGMNMPTPDYAVHAVTTSYWIARLRQVRDRKDEANEVLKRINAEEREIENGLLAAMDAAGLNNPGDKVSTSEGTAIRQQKWRAKYEPEKWGDFFRWCAEHDRADLIQRRTSDGKLLELMDEGAAFPPGVTMEAFTDLLFRRS